jgi:hypothetical protein
VQKAHRWLLSGQAQSGAWEIPLYRSKTPDKRQTIMLTAYVTRTLASLKPSLISDAKVNEEHLEKAFRYLSERVAEIDEPYLLASFALAAESKHPQEAALAHQKLRTLAHSEREGAYWNLETNTPFYGWGTAGRIETTALVVQALASGCNHSAETSAVCDRELINRGLLFLLKEKDEYGVWYSTQATINVLQAMLKLFDDQIVKPVPGMATTAEVLVNGQSAGTIQLPVENKVIAPVVIDLSSFLRAGANHIEVRRDGAVLPASLHAIANYYVPWSQPSATTVNGSSALRLLTRFDRTESKVSEEINCHVEAERIGFHGYGMLLAEIGLPPGAEVDRATLERAVKESGFDINHYDILPDRVVLYLWPRTGSTKLDFKFKPRFALNAKTAASSLYDYYNPDARAVVPPAKMVVR